MKECMPRSILPIPPRPKSPLPPPKSKPPESQTMKIEVDLNVKFPDEVLELFKLFILETKQNKAEGESEQPIKEKVCSNSCDVCKKEKAALGYINDHPMNIDPSFVVLDKHVLQPIDKNEHPSTQHTEETNTTPETTVDVENYSSHAKNLSGLEISDIAKLAEKTEMEFSPPLNTYGLNTGGFAYIDMYNIYLMATFSQGTYNAVCSKEMRFLKRTGFFHDENFMNFIDTLFTSNHGELKIVVAHTDSCAKVLEICINLYKKLGSNTGPHMVPDVETHKILDYMFNKKAEARLAKELEANLNGVFFNFIYVLKTLFVTNMLKKIDGNIVGSLSENVYEFVVNPNA